MAEAEPPSHPLVEGAVVADRYRVLRCLKRGGMGGVYQVVDMQTDRLCALKVMLSEAASDDDLRQRFSQEASVVGRIRSDHVVTVTDKGVVEATGTRFIVMELLDGEDLGARLARCGRLDADDAVTLLSQVAVGLDRIHAHAVVHRDLKPENIFLCRRDDGAPLAKILDFGIAKNLAGVATLATTRALGTPLYMAPEQLTGDATIDAKADLYSLAQTAYTLLVGKPYWVEEAQSAPSAHAFCNRVIAGGGEPPTARARRQGVDLPPRFDGWFARASAVAPDERFASAVETIAALADALAVARPERLAAVHTTPRPSDAGARRRWLWAAVAATGIVGVAIATWLVAAATSSGGPSSASVSPGASPPADTGGPPEAQHPEAKRAAIPRATSSNAPQAPRSAPSARAIAAPSAPPRPSGTSDDPLDHL
jgi:serine/threonine-protein kinase